MLCSYTRGLPVRPRICLSPPDIMEAMSSSALPIFRGPGLGMGISSLATPGWLSLCSLPLGSSPYRTRFVREPRLLEVPKTRPSKESRNLICKGSSSPNCSARSPVSLHEKSESGDGDREREERRSCFSCACSPRSPAPGEDRLAGVVKVRRGIFAGRRVDGVDGMVAAGGLSGSSPLCPMRWKGRKGEGEGGEWIGGEESVGEWSLRGRSSW
jgi:hypothetical protein